MQMLIEGLRDGRLRDDSFAHRPTIPLLRKLVQLVMTDEAFHHKFGRIWADLTVPKLDEEEHRRVEDWSEASFGTLLLNLASPDQKRDLYARFGLDPAWVEGAIEESFTDAVRRKAMSRSTNAFRVMIKTLLHAGIISERTRETYARWVDMEELRAEGPAVGQEMAERSLDELREINRSRKKMVRTRRP